MKEGMMMMMTMASLFLMGTSQMMKVLKKKRYEFSRLSLHWNFPLRRLRECENGCIFAGERGPREA